MRELIETVKRWLAGASRGARVGAVLAILALAFSLRWEAASHAHPVQSDAFHFVDWAVAYAHGQAALNTHWSQGPMLLAAAAEKLGRDPRYALQYSTLLAGVLACAAGLWLAWVWMGRWPLALAVGLVLACNPTMIEYSVNGLAEMPYVLLLLLAAGLVLRALKSGRGVFLLYPAAFALLGLGFYYRPAEALQAAGALAFYAALSQAFSRPGRGRQFAGLAAGLLALVLIVVPYFRMLHAHTDQTLRNSKIIALACGEQAYDSKAYYTMEGPVPAEVRRLEELGVARYLWSLRGELLPRWLRNQARAARHYNDHLFAGSFRMGMSWFAVLLVLAAGGAVFRERGLPWLLPAMLAACLPAVAGISCVFPRWLVPGVPFLVMGLLAGWSALGRDRLGPAARAGALALLLLFCWRSAVFGVQSTDTHWQETVYSTVAQKLRYLAGPDDLMMTTMWPVAHHFDRERALRHDRLPYGELDELARFVDRKKVRWIVLSDRQFTHWPVNRLFDGGPWPANWREAARLEFDYVQAREGPQRERGLIIECAPLPEDGPAPAP